MKKRGPLLAAFCIPLLITLIICVNREIYPFGDQCMLHIDMYHQYCPFFTELMEKLKTGGSPFYSWNIGLGADFVSLYAYYLASPLNWLLILWPRGYVIEFMTALSILKIALSGLTFTYYLGEHFLVWQDAGNAAAVIRTEKKTAMRLPAEVASYAAAVCGAAYALCAFMAAYAWNLMWTDCMVLAPLVILHSEQLLYFDHDLHFSGAVVFALLDGTPGIGVPGMDPLCVVFAACGSHRRSADPSDGKGALLKRGIRNIVPGDDGVVF